MDKRPLIVVGACVVLMLAGFMLAGSAPALGGGMALAGILILGGFLAAIYWRAWRGDQWRAQDPGSVRRDKKD